MIEYFSGQGGDRAGGEGVTVVSPDAGGVERARAFCQSAQGLRWPSSISGGRKRSERGRGDGIIGDVQDQRTAQIVDDLIDTAGTLVKAGRSAAGMWEPGQRGGACAYACGAVRTAKGGKKS